MNLRDAPADRCRLDQWFWSAIRHLGVQPSMVLRHARIPLDVLDGPHHFFTTIELFAIFDALETISGDPAIGIKFFEASMKVGSPAWFVAAIYAPDYRQALAHIVRFKRFVMPERMEIEQLGSEVHITKEWFYAPKEAPALVDSSFAFLLEVGRHGTGQRLSPLRVELVRRGPISETHRSHFSCPILHGASRNALVMRAGDMELDFIARNSHLFDILTPALTEEFRDQKSIETYSDAIKAVLKRTLSRRGLQLANVAREMGTSDRTLQRRVTQDGNTFSNLVREARHELARELLSDHSLAISRVASLLGYQDTTSFHRAFKHWQGQTPRQWRNTDSDGRTETSTSLD